MRLSVITDEISDDLDTALGLCSELGIATVELRGVGGANVVAHDAASIGRIRTALAGGGFACDVIDTPFLKTERPLAEWDALERGFEAAHALGAGAVRVFAGMRDGDLDATTAWAAETLAEAQERARGAGLRVVLENEFVCAVATAAEVRALLDRLPETDGIGVVWDPGNEARFTGARPDPAGYEAIRDRIAHVHVKDVDGRGEWTRVGDGLVDWGDELRRLAADGYDGLLALETHYHAGDGGLPAATRECAASLRALAADAEVELR